MASPINYIKFYKSGVMDYTFLTDFVALSASTTAQKNAIIVGTEGLFTPGENDAEAVERTYSSGSVLPPAPRFSGKDFSIDLLLFSRGDSANNPFTLFKSFSNDLVTAGTFTVETDWPHSLSVQLQRIDILNTSYKGGGRVSLRIFLKSSSS